jgi:hypothetical protein
VTLSKFLEKHGWATCSCRVPCSCAPTTIPEWADHFGIIHNVLKCLDMSSEESIYSDDFISGIRQSRSLPGKHNRGKDVLTQLVMSHRKDLLSSHMAQSEEDDIAFAVCKKGLRLRNHASGFACGNVIGDMFSRWNYLRTHCRSEESRLEELKLWVDELMANIVRTEHVKSWMCSAASKLEQPLQYEIWAGVMFWHLQHVFFLTEDIRILLTMKIEEAYCRLESGLLLWQLGWLQTDNLVCEEVSKIMFMQNGAHI